MVLVVGRRAGKTRITHGIPTAEALTTRAPYLAASTAQNMTAATRRLRETWDTFRRAAPTLAPTSRLLTGVNHAAVEWRYRRRAAAGGWEPDPTVARLAVFPPTASAVRGDAYRFMSVDEALTLTADDGQALLEAASPTLAEHHGHAQLWVLSNEGKHAGGWLEVLKRRGRAAVDAGQTTGLCYVEYSMAPDQDPQDPATWHTAHPSAGLNLTDAAFRHELDTLGVDAFAREYLNYRPDDPSDNVIDLAAWDAAPATPADPAGRRVLAFDVTPDRRSASVVGVTGGHLDVLATEVHPSQLPQVLAAYGAGLPVFAVYGQQGIVDDLRRRGVRADTIPGSDYRAACQQMADAVRAGTITHTHDPDLRRAWEVAAPSWWGDTWVLSARRSGADITPAVAAVVAWRAYATYLEPLLV